MELTVEHRVDTDSKYSLQNWIAEYGMTCATRYEFGLFGSMFFFAVVISSLLFAPLGDKLGRKVIVLVGMILCAIG